MTLTLPAAWPAFARFPRFPRFTRAQMIFSAKSFASGMLAMYIASRAGLPRPFWGLLTAYVVANPLAGAVRSKALYRFIGTLVGSTAAVLLVPTLSNAPELLTLALALWVGLCLYVSLLDRTPRAYVFMLSGYTAALIGFPSVQAPLLMFDTAVARVEEIGLAILCATVVHSLVLPAGLAPSLLGLLDRTLGDARRWLSDVITPNTRRGAIDAAQPSGDGKPANDNRKLAGDRRQLAADITQLRLLSTHVPFDTTHLRWTAGALRAMQDRVAALTPTLSAVEDRLVALQQAQGTLAPDVTAMLALVSQWVQVQATIGQTTSTSTQAEDDSARAAQLLALHRAIQAVTSPAHPTAVPAWERGLRIGLASGLAELIEGWQACAALRREIDAGLSGAAPSSRIAALGDRVLHRDHGMALLSAFAAVLSICICSAFWILTGWSSGAAAAMMAAVFCSFFAAMDDPVPAIHGFLKFTLWSVPVSALYVLLLMPLVHDFGMLVVICAPLFLLLGCFMARPATGPQALAFLFGVAGTLALHDTASADLASFFNSTIAQVLGIVVAARVTRLVRSVGADWSARRIQRAIWRELGEMATSAPPTSASSNAFAAYAVRMLDRIGLLAPRIAQGGASADLAVADDALRDLRVGADIVALQRVRPALVARLPMLGASRLLTDIGTFFRGHAAGNTEGVPAALLADIDASLATVLDSTFASEDASNGASNRVLDGVSDRTSTGASNEVADARSAVTALVGLRRNLFPGAPQALTTQAAVPALQGAST